MNRVQSLEDFELAFLYKYRYNKFLPKTIEIIIGEIKNRNLTEEKINELIELKIKEPFDNKNKYKQCPFCKSFKIFTYKAVLQDNSYSNMIDSVMEKGKVINKTKKYCIICGNEFNKKKNLWKMLENLLFN